MADEQQQPANDEVTGQNYSVGGTDGGGFAPAEGGTTQGGDRVSPTTRRFLAAQEHVQSCPDEKTLRDRTGPCTSVNPDGTPCGGIVQYGQTECPHGVLILGTCPNCGTNYDRAGWTNKPATATAAPAPQSQEA